MHCTSCGCENPEGMKFCEECGTRLVRACPSCGQQVRPTAKFCGACGTTLAADGKPVPVKGRARKRAQPPGRAPHPAARPTTALPHAPSPEAERRQLTVMFCDLVGSTALSAHLDPEELREVMQAYHQVSAEAIDRFDGQVAQHLGDGLLVYFGYPVAHEDDAQRAVRTGLAIVGAIQELSQRLTFSLPQSLQVRIGIHTGLVVIGEVGSGAKREHLALGETPNIAARVQGIAEPNTVVISAVTSRLVQGLFECQDRGPQELKGVSTPVPVYRVLRESEAQSRFEVAVSKGLTPLVGREEELGLLRRRWEQAKVGDGQVEEGLAQIRQGIAADQAIGAEVGQPLWLTLLAEAYGKGGQVDEGLNALAEGLTVAHKTGEGLHEPELYHLKGELTLQQTGSRLQAGGGREKTKEAEECFAKAIEVARKQQAKSLELRAVVSLSRLWQKQGKKEAARQMLAEIYSWFTEGFDTKDLQEAKALLEELS